MVISVDGTVRYFPGSVLPADVEEAKTVMIKAAVWKLNANNP